VQVVAGGAAVVVLVADGIKVVVGATAVSPAVVGVATLVLVAGNPPTPGTVG